MTSARKLWCEAGRPRGRSTDVELMYKNCKAKFRSFHRLCIQNFLTSFDKKIENDAETDQVQFWRDLNARRHGNKHSAGAGINFDGTIVRDREGLTAN